MWDRIPALCKELRQESNRVSVRKLMQLDRSDRILLEKKLEDVIDQLLYVQTVGEAKCSVVVEAFEFLGGEVPTAKN